MDTEQRPVLSGLVALVVAAVVFGVLGGLALVIGTRVLGFGGGDSSEVSTDTTAGETLYLPEPTPTETTEPEVVEPEQTILPTQTPETTPDDLTLSAGQTTVSSMGQIDLSGTYLVDGAILKVQRFEGSDWADFPVTVQVSGGTYRTYVMTGRSGVNKFRMIDTDSGKTSNEVEVTVG